MSRKPVSRSQIKKPGAPPGSLVHVGEKKVESIKITVIDYNKTELSERCLLAADATYPFRDSNNVSWINVEGLHDTSVVERLGTHFGIHPLALEDILNTTQRPRCEEYDGFVYIVLKMLFRPDPEGPVVGEQVSLVVGKNFVLSFQEGHDGDVFEPVRQRIRSAKGRIRGMGVDYLAYALIDAIVDGYFVVLEDLGEELERIEEELTRNPSEKTLAEIYAAKRSSIFLRRAVWPLREALTVLERTESKLVTPPVRPFFRDVYAHAVEVMDVLEAHREMVAGMLEIYLSSISHRLNRVMMVLALVTTIFMPLTFVAGIYGMNFKYMPELESPWGYPGVIAVMILMTLLMIRFFRRKGWLWN